MAENSVHNNECPSPVPRPLSMGGKKKMKRTLFLLASPSHTLEHSSMQSSGYDGVCQAFSRAILISARGPGRDRRDRLEVRITFAVVTQDLLLLTVFSRIGRTGNLRSRGKLYPILSTEVRVHPHCHPYFTPFDCWVNGCLPVDKFRIR